MRDLKRCTDQTGREVTFRFPPERIISLVPSQTELLYDLGLDVEVVGQTLFCIHPKTQWKKKVRIGGTKKLNIAKIRSLKPHLIIANKEENDKKQIEELAGEFPVWISDIKNLQQALSMIRSVGDMTGKEDEAAALIDRITRAFHMIVPASKPYRTLYLVWRKPYMAAGQDTFINSMLQYSGCANVCREGSRYPELDAASIRGLNPQLILLSSEPYPFTLKHVQELLQICPTANVMLVDGEMFSWYGSRLLKGAAYIQELQKSFQKTETMDRPDC